ncbi:MAG: hypothetical protein DHS20C14_14060 [Phycisphaeraceae bacterium]|nr:MAG: hypothetical protein DHS20C14_14060 [Phycisphaeraceae bacterium]
MLPKADAGNYHIRDHTRYHTTGVTCNQGEVVDLSGSGMRFRITEKPYYKRGDSQRFVVGGGGQNLNLTGRVVWVKKKSLLGKTYEVGVEFQNLAPKHRKAIEEFAVHGFIGEGSGTDSQTAPRASVSVEVPDLYALLGVARDASDDQVHSAFRTLAKELHPDTSKDPNAGEQFTLVTKAFRVLQDPDSRERYDRMLSEAA